jgi:hypothetical protein
VNVSFPVGGSGHAAPLNLFETSAGQAVSVASQASREKVTRGERPHETLAEGQGASLVGLISPNVAKATEFANDIKTRVATATNSANGPAGVAGVHQTQNGLANIQEGVAVLSGKK